MASDEQLRGIRTMLEAKLSGLNQRLVTEADTVDLGAYATAALIDALAQIPGALSVAADMVSTAMFKGLGDTFDEHADSIDQEVGDHGGGWLYSSVMDGATCDECATNDGDFYPTWEEIQAVLPNGGPNPDCYGGDRCRCRAAIA